MKKTALWLCVLVFAAAVLAPAGAGAAKQRSVKVTIEDVGLGYDGLSMGRIEQLQLDLRGKKSGYRINMRDVFEMYPEHTGVYGIVYSDKQVEVTAVPETEGQTVSGTGAVEFSFPGAESCVVTGEGFVYGYFLPVAYLRLSAETSLEKQAFDTSYLTATAVGHSNMFMLADPHVYVYQANIAYEDSVYKTSCCLGPVPEGYERYRQETEDLTGNVSFAFDTPVLIQCCGHSAEVYDTDRYYARPMIRIAEGDEYEVWIYRDYAQKYDLAEFVETVFREAVSTAEEQILMPGLKIDKIMTIILGQELAEASMAEGLAVYSELPDRIGFNSFLYLCYDALSKKPKNYDYYLLAHEIGHFVHGASLASLQFYHTGWVNEGFATWFGEKVAARLGKPCEDDTEKLNKEDSELINRFHTDLVYGITEWEAYSQRMDDILFPGDLYSFGSLFFRYLEDRYGEGFFKKISEHFYTEWYQGQEDQFFRRRNELTYNVDLYYRLFREALGEDVYTAYPAYAAEKLKKYSVTKVIQTEAP